MSPLTQTALEVGTVGAPPLAMMTSGPAAVLAIITAAVEKGTPADTMEKLQEMFHKEQDRDAAREFAAALAQFQQQCPAIPKTKTAKVTSRNSGTGFEYTYAPLETIAATVNEHLHPRGLSFSWTTRADGQRIVCTCILRHSNGHSISSEYPEAITDSTVPGAAIRIATSVAMRRSLIQVLGLTTTDPATDGEQDDTLIDDKQVANLKALLDEVAPKDEDRARFLKFMGVERLADIQTQAYAHGVRALEKMRKKA